MNVQTTKKTAVEVCVILDSLSALSHDLSCHGKRAPDELVLSAAKTRDVCSAIDQAVASLKEILAIAEAAGGGPVPPAVADRLDDATPG